MSSYRRRSLDTWSDLSSDTTNGAVEWTFTTDPDWAADAVVHTQTGIELNFERLNTLCMAESLPPRISIDVLSFPASNGSRAARHELPTDDRIESTHFTPSSNRNVSKLNGAKMGPFTQQLKKHDTKTSSANFTRTESIIEQEIRIQQEREKAISEEREMIARTKISSPVQEQKSEPAVVPDPQPSPVQNNIPKQRVTPKLADTTPKLNDTTPKAKSKPIYQLNGGVRSPLTENRDPISSSPWYSSESPIARDIRTTHEREEALKTVRRQTKDKL